MSNLPTGLSIDMLCFTYFINKQLIICKVKNFMEMYAKKEAENVLIFDV